MVFELYNRLLTAWNKSAEPFNIQDYIAVIKQVQSELQHYAEEVGGYRASIKLLPPCEQDERLRFGIEISNAAYYPNHPRLQAPRMTTVFTVSDYAPNDNEFRMVATSSDGSMVRIMKVPDLLTLTQQEIKRAARTTYWSFLGSGEKSYIDEIFEAAKTQQYQDSRFARAKQIYGELTSAQVIAEPAH